MYDSIPGVQGSLVAARNKDTEAVESNINDATEKIWQNTMVNNSI